MNNTRIHIIGYGVNSAIGLNGKECLHSLETSHCGISINPSLDSIHRDVLPIGEIKLTNNALCDELAIKGHYSRTGLLGLKAAKEAMFFQEFPYKKYRVGFISGNTVGGMDQTEKYFASKRLKLSQIINHTCASSSEFIASHLNITDFVSTINTACSSSVNAIILGARLIQCGKLDVVIAGGVDALSKFTLNGFMSLKILDSELCKPFDANRKGLNLGEGAGYIVLTREEIVLKEQIKSQAILSAYANTNDSFHQTASSPEGRGSTASMVTALKNANLSTTDIQYINVHGTGTNNNDASEGTAIKNVFGNQIPRFSSTKSYTGHTLGASGGIEAVFSILAIQEQSVFPNLRFKDIIPELGIIPQSTYEKTMVQNVMSNSFGFGGNCSTIILSKNMN